MSSKSSHTTLLATAALALAACAAPRQAITAPMPATDVIRVKHGDREAIARARADSARLPYVEADVHFMSGMISHHAQAIAMARWAPTHKADPAVQRLAARIINAQSD